MTRNVFFWLYQDIYGALEGVLKGRGGFSFSKLLLRSLTLSFAFSLNMFLHSSWSIGSISVLVQSSYKMIMWHLMHLLSIPPFNRLSCDSIQPLAVSAAALPSSAEWGCGYGYWSHYGCTCVEICDAMDMAMLAILWLLVTAPINIKSSLSSLNHTWFDPAAVRYLYTTGAQKYSCFNTTLSQHTEVTSLIMYNPSQEFVLHPLKTPASQRQYNSQSSAKATAIITWLQP